MNERSEVMDALSCPECDVLVGRFPVEDGKLFDCPECKAKLVVHVLLVLQADRQTSTRAAPSDPE